MKLKVGILVSPCPSVSALFSMLFSALWLGCGELGMRKYSPRYGWNADIMRRFLHIPVQILPSAFSPHFFSPYKNAEISPRSCPNTPSAFPPHFSPYKNAEISPRSCPNTPAGLSLDILKMESWTHMGRTANIIIKDIIHVFASISKIMLILLGIPSAFSPQGKCGDLGYGRELSRRECPVSQLCSSLHNSPVTLHTPEAYGQRSALDHNGGK